MDSLKIQLGHSTVDMKALDQLVYSQTSFEVELPPEENIEKAHTKLEKAIADNETIYGVTTGFGDSSRRVISARHSSLLQKNLITYLTCGLGKTLPQAVCRSVVVMRLHSLARGYSAVSYDLLKRLKWMVEEDVIPKIPSQGSLGASGDLVPLAYLGQAVQGKGAVWFKGESTTMEEVLPKYDLPPYELKPKEGLALVNGTTVMAAYAHHNLKSIEFLTKTAAHATALCCIGMNGRKDAFNELINSKAKQFKGQSLAAKEIWNLLEMEDYTSPVNAKTVSSEERKQTIQDKYSLRCAPQILGPIFDTIETSKEWVKLEASGVSDNPIIDEGDEFSMGGNFYGGYISHSMDYLKISLAHLADMVDRQFMCLIDESTNRGLTPNLADWDSVSEEERFVYHGLKGLNQIMSAITSEVMAQAMPGGIFSRSSEAHNQDKVSLGLSACSQADRMIDNLYSLLAVQLIGCMQAIDLRGHKLKSQTLQNLYNLTRKVSPKVSVDRAMDQDIELLKELLKKESGAFA